MSLAAHTAPGATTVFRYKLPFAVCGTATAVLSLLVAPNISGVFGALLAILMTAIAYRDAHDYIIPDDHSAAALILGLAAASLTPEPDVVWVVVAALARAGMLALAFLAIRLLYLRLRGRHGLGLGDVKLAGVAGAWLDWTMLPVAIEIAALAALSAVLIEQLITRRRFKPTTRLPFGLFFAPAIWTGWLLQIVLPGP